MKTGAAQKEGSALALSVDGGEKESAGSSPAGSGPENPVTEDGFKIMHVGYQS